MLVGPDYVIASPTKTGTKSLVTLARSRPELGLRYVPNGHRMHAPAGCAHFTRHLIVRNPYARLASIYDYLRRRVGDWGHREAASLSFPVWLDHFLDLRRDFSAANYDAEPPSIWLATQYECWRILMADHFWRLEEIGDLLRALKIDAELPRVNQGPARRRLSAVFTKHCRQRVWEEWSRMDCEWFGYKRL